MDGPCSIGQCAANGESLALILLPLEYIPARAGVCRSSRACTFITGLCHGVRLNCYCRGELLSAELELFKASSEQTWVGTDQGHKYKAHPTLGGFSPKGKEQSERNSHSAHVAPTCSEYMWTGPFRAVQS
jgi:hypothetical protein